MAKRTKKLSKTLRLEALEQRQLLAGGFTTAQGQEFSDITHSNGNVYDQVLLKSSAITVTNDAGQITRVSFLDLNGDIVQAEFSGAGSLSIALDNYTGPAEAANYTQPDVKYVKGVASFTIQGSDATTNLSVFTVGTGTANNGANNPIFSDAAKQGGDHLADVARITVVADPSNPNGSTFGGIRAGNAVFSADSGVVGVSAANVQIQNRVIIGDINAKGSATPTLVFGTASQFGDVYVAGGGLVSENGKPINNSNSYNFSLTLAAGTKSDGTADAAETTQSLLSFTGNNPVQAQTKIYDLTGGVDTITGTTGNDTINGTNLTVTGLDSINGNGGTDSLIVNDVVGTTAAGANLGLLTVSNVENLSVNSVSGLFGDALNTTSWTGLTSETLTLNTGTNQAVTAAKTTSLSVVNAGAGDLAIEGGGGALIVQNGAAGDINVGAASNVVNAHTSASIKGGAVVVINDIAKTDGTIGTTLTSVTLDGVATSAAVTGDAVNSVTLKNLASATVLNSKATSLDVTVSGTTTGASLTEANSKATAVTVHATADATLTTLTAAGAKSLTLDGSAGKLTVTTASVNAAETVTITGSKDVKVGFGAIAALKTIDASAATGPVTVTSGIATGVVYTGGSGADSIILGASTKATTTGAGNDTVNIAGGALGAGGTVDAGEGTDTLALSAADAATATATDVLAGKISNFEKLSIGATAGATAIVMDNADGINQLVVAGVTAGNALTVTKLGVGASVEYTGVTAAASSLSLKDDSGSSDSLTVKFSATDGFANTAATTIAAVETVNIVTDDTDTTAATTAFKGMLAVADATTVTVSGDAGFDFTGSTLTKATTIDASAVTGTGTGAKVTVTAVKAATITTAGGADAIVGSTGADTISAGAGDDNITTGGGLDTITGGAGKDTFVITVPANGNTYATITDAAKDDKIQFVDNGVETFTTAKISLASTAAFQDFLDAAAASTVAGTTASNFSWFQYGGDTYVVQDNSDDSTFDNGADIVVKITGTTLDLSKATGTGTNVLTIV